MPVRNAEIVRRAYEALNRGDAGAALAALDQEAEWHEHGNLPEAGAFRGRSEIETFLVAFLDSWEQFRQQIEDCVEEGDRVAIVLHSRSRGKGSGIEVEGRYAHVWTLRNGKGVRVDAYDDVETGKQALARRLPITFRR